MPKMVKIGLNPAFKADKGDAAAAKLIEALKGKPPQEVDYVTAMENIQNSGGVYYIVPETAEPQTPGNGIKRPEDMGNDELKLTAVQLGISLPAKAKRSDLIREIWLKLDSTDVEDDEEIGA